MAIPQGNQEVSSIPIGLTTQPGVAEQAIGVWQPPRGLDYLTPVSKVDAQHASQMLNFWLDRGSLRSRFGSAAIGAGIANLMETVNFIDSTGVGHLLRFTTTKMQAWDGSTWNDIFTGFTGGLDDHFTFTAFNDTLLFSNGVDGIFQYVLNTTAATVIQGAPPCKHLSTFDGRVIATGCVTGGAVLGTRITWSVKDNEQIWPDSTTGKFAPVPVSSVSAGSSSLVQVTTSIAHGYTTGNTVQLAGFTPATYNGIWTINVVDAYNFTLQGSTFTIAGTIGTCVRVFSPDDKLGSGFEDLLNTPGGIIDQARAVFPITDTAALIVRGKSVWQMTVTGNPDAPFLFDRLYDNLGCDAYLSVDVVPGGIVGLFNDNIYIVGQTVKQPIGEFPLADGTMGAVKDQILAETTSKFDAVGAFNPDTQDYWLSNQQFVYRFSMKDKGWTRHQYPFSIVGLVYTRQCITDLPIAKLPGIISGLVGTIADLVGTNLAAGPLMTSSKGGTGYVIEEDQSSSQDADGAGGTVDSPISITTGALWFASRLQRNQLVRVELECDLGVSQTLLLEYSHDNALWAQYSTITPAAGTNQLLPFRSVADGRMEILRLSSTVLGQLRIFGLWAFGQPGAPVNL